MHYFTILFKNLILLLVLSYQGYIKANNEDIKVYISNNGRTFDVKSEFIINSSITTIWNTLTDYDNLEKFIPSIKVSNIIFKDKDFTFIYQKGKLNLFFIPISIESHVKVKEIPFKKILITQTKGTFKKFYAEYSIVKINNNYKIIWRGELITSIFLPTSIKKKFIIESVREQLLGLYYEILRRDN